MPTVYVVTRNGTEHQLKGEQDSSIMEVIRRGSINELLALCGGCCSCATCHVYVDPGFTALLPDMSEDENDLLDSSSHRKENSRLSCQIRCSDVIDGIRVQIAPEE